MLVAFINTSLKEINHPLDKLVMSYILVGMTINLQF